MEGWRHEFFPAWNAKLAGLDIIPLWSQPSRSWWCSQEDDYSAFISHTSTSPLPAASQPDFPTSRPQIPQGVFCRFGPSARAVTRPEEKSSRNDISYSGYIHFCELQPSSGWVKILFAEALLERLLMSASLSNSVWDFSPFFTLFLSSGLLSPWVETLVIFSLLWVDQTLSMHELGCKCQGR